MTSFIKRIERDDIKELTAHDRYLERQRIAEEQHIKREWVGLTDEGKHMSLKQAAEQALEALRYTTDHLPAKTGVEREVDDAITALQLALVKSAWVGLTKEEFEEAVEGLEDLYDCWAQIEQALKDKNT